MDTVTYPDPRTVRFVRDSMIALRVNTQQGRDLAMNFHIKYTPTVITLDGDGKEHHRSIGFQPPEEFVPALMLGIGKAYFDDGRFEQALSVFDKLLSEYPRSQSAATASDLRKVCLSKRGRA